MLGPCGRIGHDHLPASRYPRGTDHLHELVPRKRRGWRRGIYADGRRPHRPIGHGSAWGVSVCAASHPAQRRAQERPTHSSAYQPSTHVMMVTAKAPVVIPVMVVTVLWHVGRAFRPGLRSALGP
jgi:hypothetical protein